MPRTLVLCFAALVSVITLSGQNGGDHQRRAAQRRVVALRSLSLAFPKVRWESKSIVDGDIACDGLSDQAFLGHRNDRVCVGLVRAADQKPQLLEFGTGADRQDAICEGPGKLGSEALDYDLDRVKGFRRSHVCKGLILSGGDCDPIHIFWNPATRSLNWWRN